MRGRELAVQFLARFPNTSVLFSLGYSDEVIAHHRVLDRGAALLQKPLTQGTMERAVRAPLDQAAALW